jgi:hypothetical protein
VCSASGGAVRIELAEIFRRFGAAYRARYRPSHGQARVMAAIEDCRTAVFGGHVQTCDRCGKSVHRYHSCRNRHCPKCQTLAKEHWVEARQDELLRTRYDHVVFTLPHALNPLIRANPRLLYGLLFKAAAQTLLAFGHDPRWIGGQIGFILVLHTWGQALIQHVHVHGLVTAGGLSPDGTSWLPAKKRFLFPVCALSEVFRAKYLEFLARARKRGELSFTGKAGELAGEQAFDAFLARLKQRDWVVYSKPPFEGPKHVIAYLGRYTHRIAISNDRIVAIDKDRVLFRWRDYRDACKIKIMSLEATKFIRRFLLHVLPSGFMRIRHYGLLANRHRRKKLALCRKILNQSEPEPRPKETAEAIMLRLTGRDILACPHCRNGHLVVTAILEPQPRPPRHATGPP